MTAREWLLRSAELWPAWTWQRRRRWVRHARYAARCVPRYGRMLPMHDGQIPREEHVFAARTMRESVL